MDLPSPDHRDCIYTLNRRPRLASVLHVVFEDATLTQCDFYRVLKRDAIRVPLLLVHACTYALIVVFKSTAQAAIYTVLKILLKSG